MIREYDEPEIIVRYVVRHYNHLMTRSEQKAFRALLLSAKADAAGGTLADKLRKTALDQADRLTEEALEMGADAFSRRVAERILRKKGKYVDLNRCPQCDRIPRTPKAKQCPWCFYQWHDKED